MITFDTDAKANPQFQTRDVISMPKTKSINDDQILDITSRFSALSTHQVSQVSTKLENFGDIVPAVLDILRKSTNPETKDAFRIPAMLVAGVAGRKYQNKIDQANFLSRILREMGQEGQDWASLPKSEVFGGAFDEYRRVIIYDNFGTHRDNLEQPLVFDYDCLEEGPVMFRPDCGPSSKFYFVTPLFALQLLMKMHSKRQDIIITILLEISKVLIDHSSENTMQLAICQAEYAILQMPQRLIPIETTHNRVRDLFALQKHGKIESKNRCGVADVETHDEVIEVKPVSQWMHGLGQVLAYGCATNKRRRLVLFGEKRPTGYCFDTCKRYKVEVNYVTV